MIVGPELRKQSREIMPWGVDFAAELGVGETISAAVFRAVKESDASDATTAMAQGTVGTTVGLVTQSIRAGAHGDRYTLELKVTTSLGHVWEAEQRLRIVDVLTPPA